MKRIVPVVFLAACAGKAPASAEPAAPAAIASASADANTPAKRASVAMATRGVDLDAFVDTPEVQSVIPAEAAAMLNLAGVRAHPSGARIREHIVERLGDGETFDAIDWMVFVGPDVLRSEDGIVLVRSRDGVDVSWIIDRANRAHHPIVGKDRVVARVRPDLAAITREADAAAAARAFAKVAPSSVDVHDILTVVARGRAAKLSGVLPEEVAVDRLRVVVEGYADGSARFRFDGHSADPAAAAKSAEALDEWLARIGHPITVRLATRGLLNDAHATAKGDSIAVVVEAGERQVEALVELFGTAR